MSVVPSCGEKSETPFIAVQLSSVSRDCVDINSVFPKE